MSEENGIATIGWEFWRLFNLASYVPTFGRFGGPGYTGEHRFDDNNICAIYGTFINIDS